MTRYSATSARSKVLFDSFIYDMTFDSVLYDVTHDSLIWVMTHSWLVTHSYTHHRDILPHLPNRSNVIWHDSFMNDMTHGSVIYDITHDSVIYDATHDCHGRDASKTPDSSRLQTFRHLRACLRSESSNWSEIMLQPMFLCLRLQVLVMTDLLSNKFWTCWQKCTIRNKEKKKSTSKNSQLWVLYLQIPQTIKRTRRLVKIHKLQES